LRLFIDRIKDSGTVLEGEEQPPEAMRRYARLMGEQLTFLTPLHYRLRALKVDEIVEVEGYLHASFKLTCSRCLGALVQELDTDFAVTFAPDGAFAASQEDEDGVELSADELGLSLYEGDEIDLRETIYEQIVLALPSKQLCSEECKGLCPNCGADLNHGTCQCDPEPFNSKFSALKHFKPDA